MQSFGKWLRETRLRSGLSQEELAGHCGVTGSYISRLEHELDHTKSGAPIIPSVEVVDAMAGALGVGLTEVRLAAGYAPPEADSLDERELRLVAKLRRLPPEVLDVVELEIEALFRKYARRK